MAHRTRWLRWAALAAALALGMSACGGGTIKNASGGSGSGSGSGKSCSTFNIAVNPWVGYEADAYVVGTLAKKKLGCQVAYHNIDEQPSWAGMASGTIDTILENWGHQDLAKKYIKQEHVVQDAGQTGNKGIIGWYVPPWLAKAHPDITNWKNLNKYYKMFRTSESGNVGELLDGSPSYVTNDQALVHNLHLKYKVVVGGSEAALIQSFRTAQKQHKALLAYFYEPQWFFSEMKLVHVNLPKYSSNPKVCPTAAAKIRCDYPPYNLNKLISTQFAKSGSPAVALVKNFHWTNADQNLVAEWIAKDHMSPTAAAQKFIKGHQSLVNQWLQGT